MVSLSQSNDRSSRSRSFAPHAARRAARYFVEKFPGRPLYAVKANPSPELLQILWESGVTHYDVASLAEVRLVARTLPEATLCFMHPVKAEEAIREAYATHGVRTFSLDSIEELEKIERATGGATDLTLCVRLRVSSDHSKLSLAAKFGCDIGEAAPLLLAARQLADVLGICFHVGSQAMSPRAYADAMERVRAAIVAAAVTVDLIDVGGGFPVRLSGHGAAAAGNLFPCDPRRVREPADQLFGRTLVRAGPGAVRGICEPARPRREASRRRTLHQRRRLWRAVRCGAYRLALPGRSRPRRAVQGRKPRVQLLRADLRRHGPYGGSVHAPRRRPGRRLCRDRHARRLWLRDADQVQRLRSRWRGDRRRRADGEPLWRGGYRHCPAASRSCNAQSILSRPSPRRRPGSSPA